MRLHGLFFPFFFLFFLSFRPSTWLMEVRQTLYVSRANSVTYNLFPDNSRSGQRKRLPVMANGGCLGWDARAGRTWSNTCLVGREQIPGAVFQLLVVTCCSEVS